MGLNKERTDSCKSLLCLRYFRWKNGNLRSVLERFRGDIENVANGYFICQDIKVCSQRLYYEIFLIKYKALHIYFIKLTLILSVRAATEQVNFFHFFYIFIINVHNITQVHVVVPTLLQSCSLRGICLSFIKKTH